LQQPLAEIWDAGGAPTAHDVSQARSSRCGIHLADYVRNGFCDAHLAQADVAWVKQELGNGDTLVAQVEDLVVFGGRS
jgi:hypothetical protein